MWLLNWCDLWNSEVYPTPWGSQAIKHLLKAQLTELKIPAFRWLLACWLPIWRSQDNWRLSLTVWCSGIYSLNLFFRTNIYKSIIANANAVGGRRSIISRHFKWCVECEFIWMMENSKLIEIINHSFGRVSWKFHTQLNVYFGIGQMWLLHVVLDSTAQHKSTLMFSTSIQTFFE